MVSVHAEELPGNVNINNQTMIRSRVHSVETFLAILSFRYSEKGQSGQLF